jgi:isopenicillin N synthase-like dioxygenase
MRMAPRVSFRAIEKLEAEGFLTLSLRRDSGQIIESVFDVGGAFFRASSDEKLHHKLPNDFGYRPIGVEYSQSPDRPDPIESFTVSMRTQSEIPSAWSTLAKSLSQHMLNAIEVLEPIAEEIVTKLAVRLGGRSVGKKLRGELHRWSCLQLNYSRPATVKSSFIHEPHEDGHFLTIGCSTSPGLERRVDANEFVPIITKIDEVVIMPGDIATLLSGGRIQPLYHRVAVDNRCSERMALLFFADIRPELCEPWIVNETNLNVNIGNRVLTNSSRFGVQAFEPE